MKTAALTAIVLGVCLSAPAFSKIRSVIQAPHVPFSIDGTMIPADSLSDDDPALVERELRRLGIPEDPGQGVPDPMINRPPHLPGQIVGEGGNRPSLPAGLGADHVFRSGPGDGRTEMALGTCSVPVGTMTAKLTREGWECFPVGRGNGGIIIGTITRGKETGIVVLDENKKQVLVLRRTEE